MGGSSTAVKERVDEVKSTAHDTIDKAADAARPTVEKLSSTAHVAVDKMSTAASQAASMMTERAGQMKDLQDQVIADTRVRVREKPMTALAIAAGAGFILSRLLRR
jgi:ElaB/YqjD/DUF883 family membrane-anchored ribosome-binding protein